MTGIPQAAIDAARTQAKEWTLGIITRLDLNVDADTLDPLLEAVAIAALEAAAPLIAAAERERIAVLAEGRAATCILRDGNGDMTGAGSFAGLLREQP